MNKRLQQFDFTAIATPLVLTRSSSIATHECESRSPRTSPGFLLAKRLTDILVSVVAIPLVMLIAVILRLLNRFWNVGPVIYIQERMGRDCRRFHAVKFRTMRCADRILRGPDDPLETERITPLGHFLRRSRIDELPQFLNVLVGQMSIIGPRPDFWDHATFYLTTIPGYRDRHCVRPGITGLAQVENGYAEGVDATVEKTRHDMRYIRGRGLAMEFYVLRRTAQVLITGFGAR